MSPKTRANDIHRISVALDSNTYELLQSLTEKKNSTVSNVVRNAIETYQKLNKNNQTDVEVLSRYSELLYGGENVIVDIELWACILDELNEKDPKKFWEHVARIGSEYGFHYKKMGITDIEGVLSQLETMNWFKLKTNGDKSYVLILRTRNVEKLLKVFLENLFSAQETPVEIMEGLRKLIIFPKD
ncbi:MAG: ribbon-helix-helix protein, CopG family [Archaeoglobaceae archaeon]